MPGSENETSHRSYFQLDAERPLHFVFWADYKELRLYSGLISDRSQYVRCGDRECLNTINPFFYAFYGFLPPFSTYGRLHPFSRALRRRMDFDQLRGRREDALQAVAVCTAIDLTDDLVVLGPEDAIVDGLKRALDESRSPCILHHCCLNKVIGVDLRELEQVATRDRDVRLVHDPNAGVAGFHAELLRECAGPLASSPQIPAPAPARTVSLVGFGQSTALDELTEALALLDIRVLATPIPEITEVEVDALRRVALQVLNPIDDYEPLYEGLFCRLGPQTISPAPPYGFAASQAWLEAIAAGVGVEPAGVDRWQQYLASMGQRWRTVRQRARRQRVGIVLSPTALWSLENPASQLGSLDLLGVLGEAGFGLDLALLAPGGHDALRRRLTALVDGSGDHRVVDLSSLADLRRWLADTPCGCVYSDVAHDARCTSAGKAPFSLHLFEPGLEGAIRAADALARRCELGYFREYRAFRSDPWGAPRGAADPEWRA